MTNFSIYRALGFWAVILPFTAHADVVKPTLFCVAELATGLKPLDGKWSTVDFLKEGSRYIVEPILSPIDRYTYRVTKMGDKYASHMCEFSLAEDNATISRVYCGGIAFSFLVDVNSMRFVQVYSIGYLENDLSGDNTPSLTAGICSPISK